jgi:ATP-dependent DNA helicase RecG
MNREDQNTEWKESWRDEYLKWICGFANAQGGRIFIGIDDRGVVKGIADAKRQLEELPNKVRDILGILVDVNLHKKDELDYLEIVVEAYPFPVNYKGQYHYRSGSTKQELKGAALDRFLLGKQGRRWDGVPVPHVTTAELSPNAFAYFRKSAVRSRRLSKSEMEVTNENLLQKLHLVEGKLLKRAAILLFHPDPERFVTGAYIKIGFFKTDDDLLFQNEIRGSLFDQVEQSMDLLLTKYLHATVSYQGLQRVESYPYPENALREALLNAVAHKDYACGNPIQIRVYPDKISFWNEGQLPDNWTVEDLAMLHPSKPFNPDIASTFFRSGLIEAWGRGTIKIFKECRAWKLPEPAFKYDLSGFYLDFFLPKSANKPRELRLPNTRLETVIVGNLVDMIAARLDPKEVSDAVLEGYRILADNLEIKSLRILRELFQNTPQKRSDILASVGLTNQTLNVKRYFEPLLLLQVIAPTMKEKPSSRNQRFVITDIGIEVVNQMQKNDFGGSL